MGLCLKTDTDVLDGSRNDAVGDACKGTCAVVLRVGQGCAGKGAMGRRVAVFEPPAGGVEAAELDRDAGADAEKGGQGSLVEGEGAFVA